jgi:transposase
MDLTDEQWQMLQPLVPKKMPREDGRGRPRVGSREVLNGILWVLRKRGVDLISPHRHPRRLARTGANRAATAADGRSSA